MKMDVLAALEQLDGTLHVDHGRMSGHLAERHSGASVRFRYREGEIITTTLTRAISELQRRMCDGMPQTIRRGPCPGCGSTRSDLRYLQKQWLCAECRRGVRELADERRREERRRKL